MSNRDHDHDYQDKTIQIELPPESGFVDLEKLADVNENLSRQRDTRRRTLAGIFRDTFQSLVAGVIHTRTKIIDPAAVDTENEGSSRVGRDCDLDEALIEPLDHNFKIQETIAKGGQGSINRSSDLKFKRTVAIKSLHDNLKEKEEFRNIFVAEAKVTAQLDHPAIIPVYGLFNDDRHGLHLAMKLIRGKTFREYLSRLRSHYRYFSKRQLARSEHKLLWQRLDIFIRVCEAIAYAHHRDIIHRDLKPENIMIGNYHEAYVMDWGIAEHLTETPLVAKGAIAGTLQYIAPEVVNQLPYDQRSDIYSLGLILFEVVFLNKAYPAQTEEEAGIKAKRAIVAPYEHRFGCRVPRDLQMIIGKSLAIKPEDRYQNVRDLIRDIRNYESGEEVSANPDGFIVATLRKLRNHFKAFILTTVLLVLLLSSVIAYGLYRNYQHRVETEVRDNALAAIYANGIHSCAEFDREFQRYEYYLNTITREAALLLMAPPRGEKIRYFTLMDGASPATAPTNFLPSKPYNKKISLDEALYIIPPTLDPVQKDREIRQLYPLAKTLRETVLGSLERFIPEGADLEEYRELIHLTQLPPIFMAYFGLPDNLYLTYPYKTDLTPAYAPTTRGWWPQGVNAKGKSVWGAPYVDAGADRDIVITCSQAAYDDSGRLLGVAAVDVSLVRLLQMLEATGTKGEFVENKILVDQNANILADSRSLYPLIIGEGDSITYRRFNHHRLNDMWMEKNGWFFDEAEGKKYLYFYLRIESLNWLYIEKIRFDDLIAKRIQAPADNDDRKIVASPEEP